MNTIKISNICKHINDYKIDESIIKTHSPKVGDVAIFEVIEIGSLKALQNFKGRNCHIFEGDKLLLAFGNRYASKQFEGYVPDNYLEEYDFIGKGGIAGVAASMHFKLLDIGPTKLKLVGYATDKKNAVINTKYYHRKPTKYNPNKIRPFKTILSLGSSMDSGKTTTAAYLSRGIKHSGHNVSYIKLTGTIFNKDRNYVFDCGADCVSDFSEFGFPSTYLSPINEIMDIYEGLLNEVSASNPDYVVIEIADGLFQKETEALLKHKPFVNSIDHVILSCANSLAVQTGVDILSSTFGDRLFAVAGLFTGSPLLVDEVENRISLPVLTLELLAEPNVSIKLLTPSLNLVV